MQNPKGGFGGGHGQMPHSASSYAALLSIALVGGEEAFKLVDRVALYVCSRVPFPRTKHNTHVL